MRYQVDTEGLRRSQLELFGAHQHLRDLLSARLQLIGSELESSMSDAGNVLGALEAVEERGKRLTDKLSILESALGDITRIYARAEEDVMEGAHALQITRDGADAPADSEGAWKGQFDQTAPVWQLPSADELERFVIMLREANVKPL